MHINACNYESEENSNSTELHNNKAVVEVVKL